VLVSIADQERQILPDAVFDEDFGSFLDLLFIVHFFPLERGRNERNSYMTSLLPQTACWALLECQNSTDGALNGGFLSNRLLQRPSCCAIVATRHGVVATMALEAPIICQRILRNTIK